MKNICTRLASHLLRMNNSARLLEHIPDNQTAKPKDESLVLDNAHLKH